MNTLRELGEFVGISPPISLLAIGKSVIGPDQPISLRAIIQLLQEASKQFFLSTPLRQPSQTADMEPVTCDTATVVCRRNSTWELTAHFVNNATEADCSLIFQFALAPNGTPPFGVTIDTDLSAAGNGRVTRIGLRTQGVPPEATITRTGTFPAFINASYWNSIVVSAQGNYSMLATWQTYPETDPDDPDNPDNS